MKDMTLTARTVKSESKRLNCRQDFCVIMILNGFAA